MRPGSILVLNDTRVLRARLNARKLTGGVVQLLLVRPVRAAQEEAAKRPPPQPSAPAAASATTSWRDTWEVLAAGLKNAGPGFTLILGSGVTATIERSLGRGVFHMTFQGDEGHGVLWMAERLGKVPLPPYIEAARRRLHGQQGGDVTTQEDDSRYQTVYAARPGAVAAPTAGLHFTPALLDQIRDCGHDIVTLTLNVGPGTFRSVDASDPRQHKMDAETYEIPENTARRLIEARAAGRPIVAVGTTVVRALESAARAGFPSGPCSTDLFMLPGEPFQMVTDLITNFHLPRSTLLMLVAAFAGQDAVMAAYREAVDQGYRFYSYGDAMFITPGIGGRS